MNLPSNNLPLISIIIPCRNEGKYIGDCLISLLNQKNLKDELEILVVDGISTDNTREIVNKLSENFSQIHLVDNPKRITPAAMNLGIKEANGKFICIMGAHAEYDEEYLSNSIKLLNEHPEVICTGGPVVGKGKTNFAKAAALALSSPIGVGNAKHHFPDYEGYVEGIGFPVFRREVFNKIGLYDEELIRNQDDEFNLRLRKNGLKVYLSPKVKSQYYVRDSPKELFKQYFDYGMWRVAVIKKHKLPASFRQLVPTLFVFAICVSFIVGLFIPTRGLYLSFMIPFLYFALLFISSIKISFMHGWKIGKYFPLAVAILHFAYGLGFIKGLLLISKLRGKHSIIS